MLRNCVVLSQVKIRQLFYQKKLPKLYKKKNKWEESCNLVTLL